MTAYLKNSIALSNAKIGVPTGWQYDISGSNDTITLASNAAASVVGNSNSVTLASSDFVQVTGCADRVYVTGTGDSVSLGGNGQYASDANVDYVWFAAGGQLVVPDYSRVTSYGNAVTTTLGACDLFAAIGCGINVTATGAGDSVWLGGNGQQASDVNLDNVTFRQGGALYLLDNSRVTSYGDRATISVGSTDYLGAFGCGLTVNVTGTGDSVWIGRNGQQASDANLDVVNFAQGGNVYLQDNSRVAFYGSNVNATAGTSDYVGAFGCGINLNVTGYNDYVWIGRNGQNASAANVDNVTIAQATFVYLQDNSTVSVTGGYSQVTVGNNDTLTAIGPSANVVVSGLNDVVTIGNGNLSGSDTKGVAHVSFAGAGMLNVATYANVVANGSHLAVAMGGNSNLTLSGNCNVATAANPLCVIQLAGVNETVVVSNTPHSLQTIDGFGQTDVMIYSKQSLSGFADLMAHAAQSGTSVVISANQGATTLTNTSLASLTASEFKFV